MAHGRRTDVGQPVPHPPARCIRSDDAAQAAPRSDPRRAASISRNFGARLSDLRLYAHPGSTNSYKCSLLLALLDVPYDRIVLPFGTARERPQWFLEFNPRGLVPCLKADAEYFWDSTAILAYIGHRFGSGSWLPAESAGLARVMQWLALAQSEILHGVVRVRHIKRGSRRGDIAEAKAFGASALEMLERELTSRQWLAGLNPTIADIACYPHIARAAESEYELESYPGISAWTRRIEQLPRWLSRMAAGNDPATANLSAQRPWL